MSRFALHYDEADARALVARIDPAALRKLTIGAATSGFQSEGGYNGPGQPQNNWSKWEGRNGVIASGGACQFWDRYQEDAALLAAQGLRAFRLSIEWPRVEPRADLTLDTEALAHYAKILAAFSKVQVEPILTLYHWTHPAALGVDFWLDSESPQRFATYIRSMLPKLLDALECLQTAAPRRFITLNEPNMYALATYLAGRFPHGLQGSEAARRCLEHQLLAHLAATQAIRDVYRARGLQAPLISLNNNFSALYRMDALFIDMLLAPQLKISRANLDQHLHAREKNLTQTMLESEGPIAAIRQILRWAVRAFDGVTRKQLNPSRFPKLLDAIYSQQNSAVDYLAFDYYDPFPWNIFGRATPGSDRGFGPVVDEWDWKPHPKGLSAALSFYSAAAPGLPVWIAENGMAARGVGSRIFPRDDGARRDQFIQAHLYEVLRALADGAPVEGYLHWSLWDNYEWGSYQPRFGLIGIDAAGGKVERGSRDAHGSPALDSLGAISRALEAGDRDALASALIAERQ